MSAIISSTSDCFSGNWKDIVFHILLHLSWFTLIDSYLDVLNGDLNFLFVELGLGGAAATKSSEEMFYSYCQCRPRGAGNKIRCLEMSYFYPNHSIHLQVAPVSCWYLQKVHFSKVSKDDKLNLKKKFSAEVLEL